MVTHITNPQAITLFINGHRFRVEKTEQRYASVIKYLNENNEQKLLDILENRKVKDDAVKAGFVISDTEVTYKGEKLPNVLAQKIRNIYNEGLPLSLFEKFWENLNQNPSSTSVSELYDFLSYKELPINKRGMFLAYKGVNSDYWSVSGNKDTVVIKGKVDEKGRIYNGIGEEIEVLRRAVDDNRENHCSFGLHAGSLEYARGFAPRLVVVEINPKDVVSVPSDYNCQKLRCSAYKVVADYTEEIVAPVVDEENNPIISSDHKEQKIYSNSRKDAITRIDIYLLKKQDEGYDSVTIRQIQNIFSPNWISKQEVLDILQELEYSWKDDVVQISGFDDYEEESDDWYDDGYGEMHDYNEE